MNNYYIIKVKGNITSDGYMIEANLNIKCDLTLTCSVSLKDVKYDVSKPYDKSSIKYLEQTLKEEGYDLTGKMDQVKTVKIDCKMEASYLGETNSEKYSITFVCAKIDGKWKLIGALQ